MRKSLLAGVATCLVLLGILVPLLLPRPSRVTRANYERIREGMSRAQAEEILGGPRGDYTTRPMQRPPFRLGHYGMEMWHGDEGTVGVAFDPGGKAERKMFIGTFAITTGLVETLRWRLERRWERLWGRGGP